MGAVMTKKANSDVQANAEKWKAEEQQRTQNAPVERVEPPAGNPPTYEEDPILNPNEVARQLGKHRNTILNWINDGLLVAIKGPSGLWGVRKSQINKFLGGSALNTRVQ